MTASHYRIVGPVSSSDGIELVEARRADDDGGSRTCVLACLDEGVRLSSEAFDRFLENADAVQVVDFGEVDGRTFIALDVPTDDIKERDIVAIKRELSAMITPTPRLQTIATQIDPVLPLMAKAPRQFSELMNVELLLDPSSKIASSYPVEPMALQPSDPMIGQVIRAHRIEVCIGEGSFGTVYRAKHVVDGHDVAIKILRLTHLRRQAYDRFKREALAMSRLTHPNLVRLRVAGRIDGRPYVIMEYVPGRTLRDVVRATVLSPERVHHIGRQIAAGLAAAHAAGCVHRDLKPLNVMVVDGHGLDHVKILDFGMVRLVDPTDDVTQITRTNMRIGTPRWSAPEQVVDPHRIDPRADLYALGLLMHYMLAGVRVVSGPLPRLLGERLVGPPDRIEAAGPLEPIIKALLEPDPDQRIPSADVLLERLDRVEGLDASVMGTTSTAALSGPADTVSTHTPRHVAAYVAIAAAALVVGIVILYAVL